MLAFAKRIVRLPLSLGTEKLPSGPHITRYAMYKSLQALLKRPDDGVGTTALAISHSANLAELMGIGKTEIIAADYPKFLATDLSAFDDSSFDYVLSDQVLEHVEGNPQDVFDESLRVLKPNGIAVHTTCFVHPMHGSPSDFWRFTPDALRYLARRFSRIVQADGFGNRGVWLADYLGLKYTPVPHAKWHPLHMIATRNNPGWPVVTWIVAQK